MASNNPNSSGWSPRRIRPGGCLILLILLGVLIWGGSRFLRPFLQGLLHGSGSGTASGGGLTPQQAQNGDIVFSTTGTKEAWARQEIAKFNKQSQGQVTLNLTESRQAMQDILNGKLQPDVWSPSSPVWTDRLASLWPQQHNGAKIVDADDPEDYRVFFKSPLVFLTTREKATRLRPLLAGPTPWSSIRQLSLAHKIKFSYADPLNASSGMLTMSLIITEYAREHGGQGDLDAVAASSGFASFLKQLDAGLDRDDTGGSSALEKAYIAAPAGRDFITAYESSGLEAVAANPDLVLIYPSPTANADQGAAALISAWVTPTQRDTSQAFLKFLASDAAQSDGVQYGFRPAGSDGADTLAQGLTPAQRAQFQSAYDSVELPPYDALNEAAAQWRSQGP